MKPRTTFYQVMTREASGTQFMQVVQMVFKKGRRICQLFCGSSDTLLCERVACCPAQTRQPEEDKTTQGLSKIKMTGLLSPPSTILIINISNSTLIDCVIGNETYPSAVVQSQPLMQETQLQMQHEQRRCKGRCGQQGAAKTSSPPPPPPPPPPHPPLAESQSIHIHSSNLNCVIIGDNNSMQVEQTH
ncbi:hypothetical protein LDENG_00123380 [Lucifuga dentata]|nr:hypothetical protein LDENG_00123380 [Lucifuga dentata]